MADRRLGESEGLCWLSLDFFFPEALLGAEGGDAWNTPEASIGELEGKSLESA